jgi:hypothetical protein
MGCSWILLRIASDTCLCGDGDGDEPFCSIAAGSVLNNSGTINSFVKIVHHGFGLIVS